MSGLQVTWFLLVGLLLTVYAVLDGFDLGVGFWHLFTRKEDERRALTAAVGPVWDGNEVWLITGGGALFAAFPPVYASVFSGFYLAMMVLLVALVFRAVSLEFREQVESSGWRKVWDWSFGLGSSLAALLFGVALGNLLRGVPLDARGDFAGDLSTLLNPYALLIGITGLAMIATHGALYIQLRIGGEQAARARDWTHRAWFVFLGLLVAASVATLTTQPALLRNFHTVPVLWVVPLLGLGAVVTTGVANLRGRPAVAFGASAASIVFMMALTGATLFPELVPALGDPARSLTLYNASSSARTLQTMLILALVGMPLVIGYTVWVYRRFVLRKLEPDEGYHGS